MCIEKKLVRYFYSPNCPESFATVDKLKNLFIDTEHFCFEAFDLVQDRLESPWPWYEGEMELLKVCDGGEGAPLLYGKLFIAGVEIPGFPPSPEHIARKFAEFGLEWEKEKYPFEYGKQPVREQRIYNPEKFVIHSYSPAVFPDVCRLCTAHHPWLEQAQFTTAYWLKYEKQKESFLHKVFSESKVFGAVVYCEKDKLGFIEAFTIPVAAQMGFPVTDLKEKGLMVTCLSLCNQAVGQGLAKKLVQALEDDARKKGFTSIEVLAFPDEHGWQPYSLYSKLGFIPIKELGKLTLLRKSLGC